ncbi:MAG: ATP-binding protein [Treponema sp.]|nr:ATP-binding protein [Treponema sp.]
MEGIRKNFLDRLHFVFTLFFSSATLMLVVTIVVSTYITRMEKAVEDSTHYHLLAAAQAASTFMTVEELDLFHTIEDMERPEWEEIRSRLQQFARDYRVLYVYYWRYEDGHIQYIIDNDEDEEWMVTPAMTFELDDDPTTAEAVPIIMAGNAWASDLGVYTTSWDGLISGLAPVFNADGSVYCAAGVDLLDEIIITQRNNIRVMRAVLLFSLALSVLSGCMAIWLYRRKALQSEKASKSKSQFLSTMSHEIRTPLNAVIGLSEVVLNRGELRQDSRSDIQQIHHSGSSLLGIINDILDISKIEAGGFELIPVEYETASFINDTISLNKVRIGMKPVELVLEIKGDFPRKLRGDELRLRQILNNIISNAIKYTREGKVTLRAEWENLPHGGERKVLLRFSVQDTGIGIREEDMNKLFTDFTQFDIESNRKIEGTGLGLGIAKKLVRMMNGDISAESEHGKGSTFTVTLMQDLEDPGPIGEETAKLLRQFRYESKDNEKNISRAWMPYGRVLVVDDLPVNLQVAKGLLEPYGLKADFALSGQEAIEMIQAQNVYSAAGDYDLVFMDQMMPGMDGIETVRIIREWEQEKKLPRELPIVALTADAHAGNMEMFLSRGFNGFITKPIDISQLDEAMNKWVRNRQSSETPYREQLKVFGEQGIEATHDALSAIPGLDVKQGIGMTGGKMAGYLVVLGLFCKDAEERLPLLQTMPDADGLQLFTTQVHALKSVSASIGAAELSKKAAEIEAASRAADMALIEKNLSAYAEQLAELVKNIRRALETGNNEDKAPSMDSQVQITAYLSELKAALEGKNAAEVDRILEELLKMTLDQKTKGHLERISNEVLMAEYENAVRIIGEI